MTNKSVFLQFDFKERGADQTAPRFFSNPVDIISTDDPQAVNHAFEKIQTYIDKGFYAAGFASFEACLALDNAQLAGKERTLPLVWFGIFDRVQDSLVRDAQAFKIGPWQSAVTKSDYKASSQIIHDQLAQGKLDEINYTIPFQANFSGDSYTYYQQLQKAQNAGYGAYIETSDFDILSASPELFFEIKDEEIMMRPMKGTIHRGLSTVDDQGLKNWLRHSKKDQYENQLTVELMQEEMKKVVAADSIRLTEQYKIEKYPTVYQMTSTLVGKTQGHLKATEIFKKLFPCSSIAGVPKQASLELIHQLEPAAREVYCGAIGYFSANGQTIFNVPIRTVWLDHQTQLAHYGAGGGITKQSEIEAEYEEVFTKTQVLNYKLPAFSLLETMALNDGKYFLLEKHMQRLAQSIDYFDWQVELDQVYAALEDLETRYPQGHYRIRLTLDCHGHHEITCHDLTEFQVGKIQIAEKPVHSKNLFLYHKTNYRKMFEDESGEPVHPVTLYLNEAKQVTEFAIGNIVIEKTGRLFTPPVACGLLPGTFRQYLIQEGLVEEAILRLEDLKSAEQIWMVNSVRKWVKVNL